MTSKVQPVADYCLMSGSCLCLVSGKTKSEMAKLFRPSVSMDNTLLDLQNFSYPTQSHSIIANYHLKVLGTTEVWVPKICHSRYQIYQVLVLCYSPNARLSAQPQGAWHQTRPWVLSYRTSAVPLMYPPPTQVAMGNEQTVTIVSGAGRQQKIILLWIRNGSLVSDWAKDCLYSTLKGCLMCPVNSQKGF